MGRFSSKKLRSVQHPYPELSSKAWNVTGPCIIVCFSVRLVFLL